MLRRTFLSLLGAVAWPSWRKKPAGPTSSSFRLRSVYWTPRETHNDAEAFRRAIAETRPIDLNGETTTIRFFHNVSGRRIEAGTCVKLVGNLAAAVGCAAVPVKAEPTIETIPICGRPTGGTFTIRYESLDGVWHEEKFTAAGERLSSVVVQPTARELIS